MNTYTNAKQIEQAETKDLITFYNKHNAEKPVKKFADRATAVKRCIALVELLNDDAKAKAAKAASKAKAKAEAEPKTNPWPFTAVGTLSTTKPKHAAEEKKPKEQKAHSSGSNAVGVASSWNDPKARAARVKRDAVSVTVHGKVSTHKSTSAAFIALGLVMSKHIKFRLILKAKGAAVYSENGVNYHFAIV